MAKRAQRRNCFGDGRLWDDGGREWTRERTNLSRQDVELLLGDAGVRVGIHADFGLPIRWVEPGERASVWEREIAVDFADGGAMTKQERRRGRLPFVGSCWVSGSDRVLIFESD
jgi:hypothetical protein